MDLGLLLLRVVVGGVMAAHGAQKLFGWFGGFGLEGTGGWLESVGFRPGRVHAPLVGTSEFGGGLLLILGFFTPFGAAAIMGVMLTAIATIHWPKGFFNTAGGYEFNLTLIAAALSLAIMGAGEYSLDAALDLGFGGVMWGVAALALAGIGATLTLSVRSRAMAGSEPVAPEEAATEDVEIDLTEKEPTRVER